MLPKRREKGLLTEELPNETIVYDTTNHKVHCLNPVARAVWRHCDGRTSAAELARLLHGELQLPVDEALVQLTLEKLGRVRLLEGEPVAFADPTSRRQAFKQVARFGVAAAAALVATIAAPTAAMAATACTGPGGGPCHGACPAGTPVCRPDVLTGQCGCFAS
jgi:hypothetical protein